MSNHFNQTKARQSGVVLVSGLIFMAVMTIIVIAALRSATLEERMAANAHNRQVALQAAEAVLREVESTVFITNVYKKFSESSFSSAAGCTQCSLPVEGDLPRWQTMTNAQWLAAPSLAVALAGVTEPPRYIIEMISFPRKNSAGTLCIPGLARITAQAQGRDSGTVFLQSVYRFAVDLPCS